MGGSTIRKGAVTLVGHVLLYVLGVVLFVVGVALSIGLHEFGHLIPGKIFNVKITQYFIGFGRTLWSKRRGETEYGIKAIPLGGYVKLVGMLPPAEGPTDEGEQVAARPTGMLAQLVSDAKRAEYEHVSPEDHDRLFYRLPVWKRITIMGCGVATNLVLAFIFFCAGFIGYGLYQPSTTIGSVEQCIKVVKGHQDPGVCSKTDIKEHPTPAAEAGLMPGDQVISFNGHKISDYTQLQDLVRAYQGPGKAQIVIERNGVKMTKPISPISQPLPSLTDPSKTISAHFIGITPLETRQSQSVGFVVSTMWDETGSVLSALAHLPQRVYSVGKAALGFEKRDPNSLMSVVGAGRVAGQIASNNHETVGSKLAALALLLGSLNLFLGLVNLVPLPPFDGAGVATALVEAVRSRWARIRGKPDPGVFDAGKLLPVTYVVAVVLLAMSVVLIYADIVAPVNIS